MISFADQTVQVGTKIETKGATPKLFTQVHGNNILEIENQENRLTAIMAPQSADGAYTYAQDLELYVFTADCLPISFWSEEPNGPIGIVHCGWRGAKAGIVVQLLTTLPQWTLHFSFGPAGLVCCYEVKRDLIESFEKAGYSLSAYLDIRKHGIFFDLTGFVRGTQLKSIPENRIHRNEQVCTICSPRLPSYRRNRSTDPSLRSWIVRRAL